VGGEHMIEELLTGVPGGAFGAVLAVMAVMFILGFFMDTLEIILIVVPITAPAILGMGVDAVWLGVMIGMNLQTAFITPPVGFALFYMRGVAPPSITTMHIYRGVIPFVALQIVGIAVLWAAPGLATWLPRELFGQPAAVSGNAPGSVLDDLLKNPGGTPPPPPSSSPLDDILGKPPAAKPAGGGDPVLDRLLKGGN